MRVLTETDNCSVAEISATDVFQLRLLSNSGSGYLWSFEKEPRMVYLLEYLIDTSKEKAEIIGEPCFQIFTFRSNPELAGTEQKLDLVLGRPWNGQVSARYNVTVRFT